MMHKITLSVKFAEVDDPLISPLIANPLIADLESTTSPLSTPSPAPLGLGDRHLPGLLELGGGGGGG